MPQRHPSADAPSDFPTKQASSWLATLRHALMKAGFYEQVSQHFHKRDLALVKECVSWDFVSRLPERGEPLPHGTKRCGCPVCVGCGNLRGYEQARTVKTSMSSLLPALAEALGIPPQELEVLHVTLTLPKYAIGRSYVATDREMEVRAERREKAIKKGARCFQKGKTALSARRLRRIATTAIQRWLRMSMGQRGALGGLYAVVSPLAGSGAWYPHVHVILLPALRLQSGDWHQVCPIVMRSRPRVRALISIWHRLLARYLQADNIERGSVDVRPCPALTERADGTGWTLSNDLRRLVNYLHRSPLNGPYQLVANDQPRKVDWRGVARWLIALDRPRLPRLRGWAGYVCDKLRGRTFRELRLVQEGRAARNRARCWHQFLVATSSVESAHSRPIRPSDLAPVLQEWASVVDRAETWSSILEGMQATTGIPQEDSDPRWCWDPDLPPWTLVRRQARAVALHAALVSERVEEVRILTWHQLDWARESRVRLSWWAFEAPGTWVWSTIVRHLHLVDQAQRPPGLSAGDLHGQLREATEAQVRALAWLELRECLGTPLPSGNGPAALRELLQAATSAQERVQAWREIRSSAYHRVGNPHATRLRGSLSDTALLPLTVLKTLTAGLADFLLRPHRPPPRFPAFPPTTRRNQDTRPTPEG